MDREVEFDRGSEDRLELEPGVVVAAVVVDVATVDKAAAVCVVQQFLRECLHHFLAFNISGK